MKRLKLFFACMLMAVFGVGNVWADTKTEGFETKAASTTYNSTVTVSSAESDCGIGWTIFYGTVSTNDKISGSKSAQMRYYSSSNNRGYVQSATPIEGLSNVAFKARVSSTNIKMTVSYSANASDWTALATNETFSETGKGIAFNYDVPSGGKYIKIEIGDGSTKPSSGNIKFIVDDVVFTYQTGSSTPTCATPTFDPEGGEFSSNSIDVEIATTTDGATIYYTTDGTNPTTSSSVYSSALNITETTTVKAMAVKTGANNSAVASATYTKVAPFDGLKLTFDVSANPGDWPTTNPTTTTNYTYTLNSTDYTFALNNVKCNSGYLMLTSVAKLGLPAIEGYKLVKVEATNSSGCSTSTKVKITEDEAGSTVVTGGAEQTWSTTSTKYTYTLSGTEAETMYYLYVSNKNCQIVTLVLYYEEVEAPLLPKAAKPTFESGDENFVTSTSVTLACTTEGAKIYYTTNGDEPTTSSTLYEGAIPVSTTTIIKAIAVADGYDKSTTAEKTFTKVEALQSLAALLEATTSTETGYNVVISDWVVTGAINNRAWISNAENTKGILLYKSNHGFTAGKKLNGVVIGTKAKIYQGYPELTSLLASEVTVSDAAKITPRETTLAAIVSGYNVEQGTVVKLTNVTYAAGTGFSDGTNTVALNTQLYGPAMVDGATYNIIGVVRYDNGPVYSIMPRSVDDVEQISGGGLPEVDGLAELKAETVGASYLVNLTDAVVTLVSGNNAFIEDATAGALIYYSGHGLAAGDKLNGQYEVTTASYNGKFEITAMTAQTGAEKTSGAEIPVTTLTIAQLNANFAANESKRIKIVGANVTDAISGSDRNGSISDGAALAVYAGVASTITLAENDNVNIIGYPGFHNTDEQLTVWAQADITVNEKEDPEISYSPATLTIEEGDEWSAPTFNNPHDLTIASYVSDNEAVATVTDEGVISLAGGLGTAVITAHTEGNATYAAGNATYTITVNEAGTYSMLIDLAKVSYDDASASQVVWNSNVVTITAVQNVGTAVNNYLPGGYTTGQTPTLITETRLYENNILTFAPKAGVTITKVEWNATAKGYAESLAKEGTTTVWTNATAVLDGTDDKKVIITPTSAGEFSATLGKSDNNKGARALSVVVYYQAEAEKDKLTASISIENMNMEVGAADILLSTVEATSNPNKKGISYEVTSGSEYVTIVNEGKDAALHAVAAGTATITATIPDNLGNYTGAEITFNIEVAAASKLDANLAYNQSSVEVIVGSVLTPATLTYADGFDDFENISYVSSNPNVATVTDEGVVSLVENATGTTTITATLSNSTKYYDAVASYTITVNEVPDDLSGTWVLASSVAVGDKIIIAGTWDDKTRAMGKQNQNNRAAVVSTIAEDVLTPGAQTKVFTLVDAGNGKFAIQASNGKYLNAAGTNTSNYLRESDNFAAVNAQWTITFDENGANVVASSENRNVIRYNSTNNSELFSCYAAGNQRAINIYKQQTPEPPLDPIAAIGGKFIINQYGDTAVFSRGNLQYQQSTNTWRCAPKQYNWQGMDNLQMGNADYEGWVDLFCWSLGAENNYGATSAYLSTAYQNKEFVDWGGLFAGEWSTLSSAELRYLLNTRSGANDKWGMAMIGENLGMILLPDEWSDPSGVTFVPRTVPTSELWDNDDKIDNTGDHYRVKAENMTANKFTLAEWAELEEAGAVFLPFAGRRSGGNGNHTNSKDETIDAEYNYTYYENYLGTYWTSTQHNAELGQADYFYSFKYTKSGNEESYDWGKGVVWSENGRYGQSVRLAHIIPRQYTVTYNANGADGEVPTDANKYLNGANVPLANASGLHKEGYVFAGWKFKGVTYIGTEYTIENVLANEEIVFEAQWELDYTTIRAELYDGKWGTICPKQKILQPIGASFYKLTYMDENGDGTPYRLFFDEIAEGADLEAGKPYLFIAEGAEIKGVKVGAEAEDGHHEYNGFCGYLGAAALEVPASSTYDPDGTNYYGLTNNTFTLLGADCYVPNERAYVKVTATQPTRTPSAPVYGRRRVVAGNNAPSVATGMDALNASEQPMKMMIDGQLFIIRGEKMFDATGRLVK